VGSLRPEPLRSTHSLRYLPRALQVNSLIQYIDVSNSVGSNTRIGWNFRSEGDLFINYNNINRLDDRWLRAQDGLKVKQQYMFRRWARRRERPGRQHTSLTITWTTCIM
jgi:hypothetical protein